MESMAFCLSILAYDSQLLPQMNLICVFYMDRDTSFMDALVNLLHIVLDNTYV